MCEELSVVEQMEALLEKDEMTDDEADAIDYSKESDDKPST
jgi:hypothetical protein